MTGKDKIITYLENEYTLKSLFLYFLRNTSLPGVNQIFRRRTIILRLFWTCLVIVGVTISCFQATDLLKTYRKYGVKERGYYRVKQQLTFPSVSICSNQPFDWITNSKNENPIALRINKTVEEELEKLQQQRNMSKYDIVQEGYRILMRELAKLTYNERFNLGYQRKDFIVTCVFDEKDCPDSHILEFNNLYYGNCFTFNPGFNGSIEAKSHDSYLLLVLGQETQGHFPHQDKFMAPLLVIHPYGEPPIFHNQRSFWVHTGFWSIFELKEIEFIRLPQPYTSKCVQSYDPDLRAKNLFYTENTPYKYSMAACFETCRRDMEIEQCKCVDPKYISHNRTWSFPVCENACVLDSSTKETDCQCFQPCDEKAYEILYKIEPGTVSWLRYKQSRDQILGLLPDSRNKDSDKLGEEFQSKYLSIEIIYGSPLVQIIEEQPEYTVADLWGAIGGNLGLIIGVSVVSMMEIFELLGIYLFRKCISMSRFLYRGKPRPSSRGRVVWKRDIQVKPMRPYVVYASNPPLERKVFSRQIK